MHIEEYWEKLIFSYLKTYSGLRNGNIKKSHLEVLNEITHLGKRIKRLDKKERASYEKRLHELKQLVSSDDLQVIKSGSLHKSAKEVSYFKAESYFSDQLDKITKIKSLKTHFMCGPIYRDAIVFYNKNNEIVEILQICFSCGHLLNQKEEEILAGDDFFKELKKLFSSINHPIDI